MVAHDDLDVERFGTRLQARNRLRVGVAVDEEGVLGLVALGVRHHHRLRGGRALVQEGRVGNVHAGQIGHHRLKVEQRLEAALRDLGLVRRVLRVPCRVLHDVAQDHRRRQGAVVAHADVRPVDLVQLRHRLNFAQQRGLADRGWLTARTTGVPRPAQPPRARSADVAAAVQGGTSTTRERLPG